VEYTKPSPDGWRHIHDGVRPLHEYLFVGDGENDRLVADAIGIDFFYIGHFRDGPGAR
jgi:phosphoglycolate phosphatase-like HAD superfamily hydrolase